MMQARQAVGEWADYASVDTRFELEATPEGMYIYYTYAIYMNITLFYILPFILSGTNDRRYANPHLSTWIYLSINSCIL